MARSATPPAARLFFGVPVDEPLRDVLGALAGAIAAEAHGRPVSATNLHATLAFLGRVERDRVAELRSIGDELGALAFDVALDRVGSFRGARVAWIGSAAVPPRLVALQADLAQRLGDAGWMLDVRPFNLHVTVARHCRVPLATRDVAALTWRIARIALYESIGTANGPRYEPLAVWPLR